VEVEITRQAGELGQVASGPHGVTLTVRVGPTQQLVQRDGNITLARLGDNFDRQETLTWDSAPRSDYDGCSLIHPGGCSASLLITSLDTATFVREDCTIFREHLTAS
jgi:hypothetical protein